MSANIIKYEHENSSTTRTIQIKDNYAVLTAWETKIMLKPRRMKIAQLSSADQGNLNELL
jgi:hypothetical protein